MSSFISIFDCYRWVCIIVASLLIRGVTIPVMIDLLNSIAKFFTVSLSNIFMSRAKTFGLSSYGS